MNISMHAMYRKALLIGSFILLFSLTLSLHLFAAPPGSPYAAGETLDPACSPGDANCSVEAAGALEIGGEVDSATQGSIFFAGTSGVLSQANSNLFWDNANTRLGIGTNTPSALLEIDGTGIPAGTELLENGDFSDGTTGWNINDCAVLSGGALIVTYTDCNTPEIETTFEVVEGEVYLLSFTISNAVGDQPYPYYDGVESHDQIEGDWGPYGDGTYEFYLVGSTTGTATLWFDANDWNDGGTWTIDDVSVRGLGPLSIFTVKGYDGSTLLSISDDILRNTSFGKSTFDSNISGYQNAAFGYEALGANTSGYHNVAMGYQALSLGSGPTRNIAIGTRALMNSSSGSSTAVGHEALMSVAGISSANTAFGAYAMTKKTSGSNNTAVGTYSMMENVSGHSNTAVGEGSLRQGTSGIGNSAVGQSALTSNTGDYNVGHGYSAGIWKTSGNNNTLLGTSAGAGVNGSSAYSNNIFLGYQAGNNTTTGSTNILIGYDIDLPTATTSNTLVIGNLLYGTGLTSTGTTVSTGSIGIGTGTTISAKLHVLATTEQLRLGYDASNYWSSSVSSAGALTLTGNGSAPSFTISASGGGQALILNDSGIQLADSGGNGFELDSGSSTVTALYGTTGLTVNAGSSLITLLDGNSNSGLTVDSGSSLVTLLEGNSTSGLTINANSSLVTLLESNSNTGLSIDGNSGVMTLLNGNSNSGLTVDGNSSLVTLLEGNSTSGLTIDGNSGTTSLTYNGGEGLTMDGGGIELSNGSSILIEASTLDLVSDGGTATLSGASVDIETVGGSITLTGGHAVYAADYSANYTSRSLTDKAYVDAGDASDPRLKTVTGDLENTLDFVMTTTPVRFTWHNDVHPTLTGNDLGFTTDQFEDAFPELLRHDFMVDGETYNRLLYERLTPILWKATQEVALTIQGIQEFTDETFVSRVAEWLGDAGNTLVSLVADRITARQELCVDDLCITKDELRELKDLLGDEEENDDDEEAPAEPVSPADAGDGNNQPAEPVDGGETPVGGDDGQSGDAAASASPGDDVQSSGNDNDADAAAGAAGDGPAEGDGDEDEASDDADASAGGSGEDGDAEGGEAGE